MMVWRSSLAGFSIRTKGRRALRKNFSMSFGSLPMSFLDFVPSSSLTAQTFVTKHEVNSLVFDKAISFVAVLAADFVA